MPGLGSQVPASGAGGASALGFSPGPLATSSLNLSFLICVVRFGADVSGAGQRLVHTQCSLHLHSSLSSRAPFHHADSTVSVQILPNFHFEKALKKYVPFTHCHLLGFPGLPGV